jgi:hypothetical protein
MIRKEAKSRFEINACNEKELSKEYCNSIFKQKFVVNTLKSYIYFSRFLTTLVGELCNVILPRNLNISGTVICTNFFIIPASESPF